MPRRPGAVPSELTLRKTTAPVTLIYRRDCPRCARARRDVAGVAMRFRLPVEEIALDDEAPELLDRLEHELPIVLIDGRKRFRRTVPLALLDKALQQRVRH